MPNGTYGGVRGRKTKVGRKLSFSSYSICLQLPDRCNCNVPGIVTARARPHLCDRNLKFLSQ